MHPRPLLLCVRSRFATEAVDDGDDKPLDGVVSRAVGRDAQRVVTAVHRCDLAVDRREVFENRFRVTHDVLIGEAMGEDLYGPAYIVIHQLEFTTNVLGELSNVEVLVDEQDADHRRGQEVRKVVRRHGELDDFLLVLGIDRVEHLVDRFEFTDGGLQVALRLAKLALKIGDAARSCRLDIVFLDDALLMLSVRSLLDKQHGDKVGIKVSGHGDRLRHKIDDFRSGGAIHADPLVSDRFMIGTAARQSGGGGKAQVPVHDGEQVEGGLSGRDAHKIEVVSEEMDDVVVLVDDDRCGQEPLKVVRIDALQAVIDRARRVGNGVARGHRLDGENVERRGRGAVDLSGAVMDIDLLG